MTKSSLGQSGIHFDLSALGAQTLKDTQRLEKITQELIDSLHQRESGFYLAPESPEISQINETIQKVKALLEQKKFKKCIFIGIGGSYLGPKLITDCFEKHSETVEFLYCENPEASTWSETLSKCDPEQTLVCVATKSGKTFETLALCLLAMKWLGEDRIQSHLLFLTDPKSGELKKLASEKNISCLDVATDVGGRYSLFTPIGLFPLCFLGRNPEAFLEGAKQVKAYFEKTPPAENSLCLLAHALVFDVKRPSHVMMPYSTRLRTFSDWWAQLWAESLGKNNLGFNPITSYGPAHQHSLLQLINEGIDDKLVCFIQVKEKSQTLIPSLEGLDSSYETLCLLSGGSLEDLMQTELDATAKILTSLSRPSFQVSLEELNERTLGALCFSFCLLTALTGKLLGINPFDQPGVEAGKKLIRQSLEELK